MKNEVKDFNWQTEIGVKDENIMCQYLTYVPPKAYTWEMNNGNTENLNIFASKAEAQSLGNLATTDNLLSVPLYIVVILFLIFTVTMSLIYMYHWVKYNLNDPFIKNFSIIYFLGLCALLIPLLFNLIN